MKMKKINKEIEEQTDSNEKSRSDVELFLLVVKR